MNKKASTVTEISATSGDNHATCTYDFGADLNAAVALFGEAIVFSNFKQSATISAQSLIRRGLSKKDADGNATPDSQETIQAAVSAWKPGVSTRTGVSKKDKAIKALAGMSAEEIQAVLAGMDA